MLRDDSRPARTRRFWHCALYSLLAVAWGFPIAKAEHLYERDDKDGFVRIERLTKDARNELMVDTVSDETIETKHGKKGVCRLTGPCDEIFKGFFGFDGRRRPVVETKDQSYYTILFDDSKRPVVAEVADKLGLEIVRAKRHVPGHIIRKNKEDASGLVRFKGRPKWPELYADQSCNGIIYPLDGVYGGLYLQGRTDGRLYFDGVSLDELAQYYEHFGNSPVVNETGDDRLYSFSLPSRKIGSTFHSATTLPGLGLSVVYAEPEIEVTVVRDKQRPDKSHPAGVPSTPSHNEASQKTTGDWIAQTKDKDAETRWAAVVALGRTGSGAISAVPTLTKLLDDEYDGVRWAAAVALWRIEPGSNAAVRAVVQLLKDDESWVRLFAADALVKISTENVYRKVHSNVEMAIPPLIESLNDKRREVRMAAAFALGINGNKAKAAVPALTVMLKDDDWKVRYTAASTLGEIGSAAKTAIPAVTDLLKDENELVRQAAADSLRKIKSERK